MIMQEQQGAQIAKQLKRKIKLFRNLVFKSVKKKLSKQSYQRGLQNALYIHTSVTLMVYLSF
jgi:hypothetical protein